MRRTPATLNSRLQRASSSAESHLDVCVRHVLYTAEGTARMDNGRLLIWKPLYRVEPADAKKK